MRTRKMIDIQLNQNIKELMNICSLTINIIYLGRMFIADVGKG